MKLNTAVIVTTGFLIPVSCASLFPRAAEGDERFSFFTVEVDVSF